MCVCIYLLLYFLGVLPTPITHYTRTRISDVGLFYEHGVTGDKDKVG